MTTVVLLAAGRSTRFGASCKLQADLCGKPIVRHAADAIIATGFQAVAVVGDDCVASLLPEFKVIFSYGQQSDSLQAGIAHVTDEQALIVLGDMPNITADLLTRIADAPAPAAAWDGDRIMPPACLPRSLFAEVSALAGNLGAGALLRSLPNLYRVAVVKDMLIDIDTPFDVAKARPGKASFNALHPEADTADPTPQGFDS